MKSNLEKRVSRILLTSLLQSDLNANELRKIADYFNNSPSFCGEFGDLLRNLTTQMEGSSVSIPINESFEVNLYERIQIAIKKRRLSKKRIIEYMQSIYPNKVIDGELEFYETQEIVRQFLSSASDSDVRQFIGLVEGASKNEDPYLKGISKRS